MNTFVHLLNPPESPHLQVLLDLLAEDIKISLGSEVPKDTNILVAGRPGLAELAASPELQALVIPWAGLPPTTRQNLHDFPQVAVYNLHHNADQTAEMAIALLLAAARRIIPADRALRQGDWTIRYREDPSLTLTGKTALVLGFGHIGQRVGRICYALGMQVIGVRRHPKESIELDFPAEIAGFRNLQLLLQRSRVLLITLPGTPETVGMIGAAEIANLPQGGILVNVGRGSIVDQAALYEALINGHLGAAGLDVWYNYPQNESDRLHTPPADFPFGELDNVVLSPHRAGGGDEIETARMQHLAKLLNTLAQGEEPENRVDIQAGY